MTYLHERLAVVCRHVTPTTLIERFRPLSLAVNSMCVPIMANSPSFSRRGSREFTLTNCKQPRARS
jgi:hypothetical protein